MISRKNFVQNITLGAGAILLPSFAFAEQRASNKKVVLLDAIAQPDLTKHFHRTLSLVSKHPNFMYSNLVTMANIDSHTACLQEITSHIDFRIDLAEQSSTIPTHFTTLLIEGFDVAHFNYQTYVDRLAQCDELLSKFLQNELQKPNAHVLIMTSMGRNNFHNEITNTNGIGGTDHHTDEAKKCFAFEVSPSHAAIQADATIQTTKELYHSFTRSSLLS